MDVGNNPEHDVVDKLTDGIVDDELDNELSRSVDEELNIVVIVDVEALGLVNTVAVHGVVEEEEEAAVAEPTDMVGILEAAGEDGVVTIVGASNILGDGGTLDVVSIVEVAGTREKESQRESAPRLHMKLSSLVP